MNLKLDFILMFVFDHPRQRHEHQEEPFEFCMELNSLSLRKTTWRPVLPGPSGWASFSTNTGLSVMLWNPLIQTGDTWFGFLSDKFGTRQCRVDFEAARIVSDPP
jgi:hypothetical protein